MSADKPDFRWNRDFYCGSSFWDRDSGELDSTGHHGPLIDCLRSPQGKRIDDVLRVLCNVVVELVEIQEEQERKKNGKT